MPMTSSTRSWRSWTSHSTCLLFGYLTDWRFLLVNAVYLDTEPPTKVRTSPVDFDTTTIGGTGFGGTASSCHQGSPGVRAVTMAWLYCQPHSATSTPVGVKNRRPSGALAASTPQVPRPARARTARAMQLSTDRGAGMGSAAPCRVTRMLGG